MRWDGTAFVPTGPIPTEFDHAGSSLAQEVLPCAILTLPKTGGTFAVAMDWYNEDGRVLRFRLFDGDQTLAANKVDLDRLAPGLRFPGPFGDADVSGGGATVRLFAGHPRAASVLLRKRAEGWVPEPGTQNPRPVESLPPREDILGDSIFYLSKIIEVPGVDPMLLETEAGWVAFARNHSPSPIIHSVAALPDRPWMLVAGRDGLYTLEADCPKGE